MEKETLFITSMLIVEKKGMLYILKLVYANSGKNGIAVHIKTSMLLVEVTGMLYIENHKISFLRVLHRPRDSAK